MTVDEIKDFATAKQNETRIELNTAIKMQSQHGRVFSGAVGAAQRAYRAYTSIIELIEGETPCDPIYKED